MDRNIACITPLEVKKHLQLIGNLAAVHSDIIRNKTILKVSKEHNINVSDDELQKFADNYRKLNKLYSSEAMSIFLNQGALSIEDFEEYCEALILSEKLKNHIISDEKITNYFFNNRSKFDYARISTILINEKNLADEIDMQLREDGEDFHQLAIKHSKDDRTCHSGGYSGLIPRSCFNSTTEAKIFNGKTGDIIGPVEKEGNYYFFLVEELLKAEPNDHVREMIKTILFDEFLLKESIETVKAVSK